MLVVIEGIDKAGKSTLVKRLCEHTGAVHIQFPHYESKSGKRLRKVLRGEVQMTADDLHRLFAANRLERWEHIRTLIRAGKTVICDRYKHSGAAYSIAKGVSPRWIESFKGDTPDPHLVIQLVIDPAAAATRRAAAGMDIHDNNLRLQRKVAEAYERFQSLPYWRCVDATQDVISVYQEAAEIIQKQKTWFDAQED